MTASATDYDDPVTPNADIVYGIVVNKELNGQPVFSIDPKTGKIFAKVRFLLKYFCQLFVIAAVFRCASTERMRRSGSL